MEQARPLLSTATASGEWLILNAKKSKATLPDGRRESEVIPSEVADTLNTLERNFQQLEGAICEQKRYLTELTIEPSVTCAELTEYIREFTVWLCTVEDRVDRAEPVSHDVSALKEQQEEVRAIKTDVDAHKPTYETINKQSEDFLEKTRPGAERDEISRLYHDIKPRWETINLRLSAREDQIASVQPLALAYEEALNDVEGVVKGAETHLSNLGDAPSGKQELHALNACQYQRPKISLKITQETTFLIQYSNTVMQCLDCLFSQYSPVWAQAIKSLLPLTIGMAYFCTGELMEEIELHEPIHKDLQTRGVTAAKEATSRADQESLENRLKDIVQRWRNINKLAGDRSKKLEKLLPVVMNYVQYRNNLLAWLSADEKRLQELALNDEVSNMDVLSQKQETMKELRAAIEDNRVVYQQLISTSEILISICHDFLINTDAVVVIGDVEEIKRRFEKHSEAVRGGEKELRNSNKTMAKVREVMEPMQQVMNEAEGILAQEPAYGTDIGQVKEELDKVNKMLDVLETTEIKLVRLSKQVTNNEYIITIIKDNRVMQVRLKERKVKLEKYIRTVEVRLKERKVKLEKYIRTVEVFQGAGRDVEVKVMGIMTFVSVEILVTDVENIKDQLQHIQNLEEEVVIHRRKIETMAETGEWIIRQNNDNEEVISEVKSSISNARSSVDEVSVRLRDRRRRLETALTEKERVYDTLGNFEKRVVKVDKKLHRAKPVSAEYVVIKEQRVSHEVVVKEVSLLNPISKYIFPAAQNLILEAPPGAEKDSLENRVSATQTLWVEVKEKSHGRHQVIESVFPSAQNYDDAYRALIIWMKDAESRVINLSPVSCDQDALNKQKKVLQEMQQDVEDHSPVYQFFLTSADALRDACRKANITCGLQPIEMLNYEVNNRWQVIEELVNASPIQEELAALNSRFDAVRQNLEREEDKLENVISNAEDFEGALNTFESWLPEAMASVQGFKPISAEPDELKKQLAEVEALHASLLEKRPLLATAHDSGNKLVAVCDGPRVEDDVAGKLQPFQEAYDALVAVVADRLGKLQLMLMQSQKLEEALADAIRWLEEVERQQAKQLPPILGSSSTVVAASQENWIGCHLGVEQAVTFSNARVTLACPALGLIMLLHAPRQSTLTLIHFKDKNTAIQRQDTWAAFCALRAFNAASPSPPGQGQVLSRRAWTFDGFTDCHVAFTMETLVLDLVDDAIQIADGKFMEEQAKAYTLQNRFHPFIRA
ncbi:predicted protein [Nematostella vectensis]|uniref:Uncharacterized protein n=1 Tax=Nematostella vectensis TaxID=45351 RepID=A7T2A4_NEMVE|nr:predicted protein [Nematostella vectensis]|eukprot:XP_001622007.1 predicted protein [Nematostella vectensis]